MIEAVDRSRFPVIPQTGTAEKFIGILGANLLFDTGDGNFSSSYEIIGCLGLQLGDVRVDGVRAIFSRITAEEGLVAKKIVNLDTFTAKFADELKQCFLLSNFSFLGMEDLAEKLVPAKPEEIVLDLSKISGIGEEFFRDNKIFFTNH